MSQKHVLTADIAIRMRLRGLGLPVGDDQEYDSKRLEKIAILVKELRGELAALDVELLGMSRMDAE